MERKSNDGQKYTLYGTLVRGVFLYWLLTSVSLPRRICIYPAVEDK